jgi:acyl-CoA synthetase (AMP-forming)/AMP-acid ligase II
MRQCAQPAGRIASQTVVSLLRMRAEQQPDNIAYRFVSDNGNDDEVTYAELDRRARTLGAMLSGIPADGRPVMLLYPPGLDYISAFFGCLYSGAIALPAAPPGPGLAAGYVSRLAAIAKDAEPGVVLTTAESGAVLPSLYGPVAGIRGLHVIAVEDIAAEPVPAWEPGPVNAESAALVQYTPGSAAPKGVVLTHRNLIKNSELLCCLVGGSEESRGMTWLPPHHGLGLAAGIIQPLYRGFPVTLMAPDDFLRRPLRWLQEISRTRATISGGPNFAYDLCVGKTTAEDRLRLDLSSWQVAFNGPEPAQAQTMEHFAQAFEPAGFRRQALQPCYGLAEATSIVTGGVPWSRTRGKGFDAAALQLGKAIPAAADGRSFRLVSCGYAPVDHCRLVIVDPATRTQCAERQVGEIWVSGSSVARSYWGRPEDTREVFGARLAGTGDGPFARSGDLGFLMDHELFITGRLAGHRAVRGPAWDASVLSVHELEPGTAQHRVAATLRCRGQLDVAALGHALEVLIARRVPGFGSPDSESGQRTIGGVRSWLADNDARYVADAQLMKWLEHAAHEPLDLAGGQLARIQLYRRETGETLALVVAHRFITDFWSMTILVRELKTLYAGQTGGITAPSGELTDFERHYCWVGGARVPAYAAAGAGPIGCAYGCHADGDWGQPREPLLENPLHEMVR